MARYSQVHKSICRQRTIHGHRSSLGGGAGSHHLGQLRYASDWAAHRHFQCLLMQRLLLWRQPRNTCHQTNIQCTQSLLCTEQCTHRIMQPTLRFELFATTSISAVSFVCPDFGSCSPCMSCGDWAATGLITVFVAATSSPLAFAIACTSLATVGFKHCPRSQPVSPLASITQ